MSTGILFLGLIALAVAVFGPYIGDKFKNWCLRPRLQMEFKSEPPYCHLTKKVYREPGKPNEEFLVYYFTFSLQNVGKSVARSCEVILAEVWKANEAEKGEYYQEKRFWPTNLTLLGNLQMDINPNRPPVHIAIGHISEPKCQETYERPYSLPTKQSDSLRFIFDFHERQREYFKIDGLFPQKKHRLKVFIVGENFSPIVKEFELYWSGIWTGNEQKMLGEECIISVIEESK